MLVLQQRFAPEREPREWAFRGGKVVGTVGHERNLTRTPVRLKASRPEVTELTHMAAARAPTANAWQLTPRGEEVLRAGASRDHPSSTPDALRMAQ